jgi:polysaccharide biosynthesis transport protein
MSELETGFRIGDVVAMIRRRLPIVVGAAMLGIIAGYLVFAGAPESFSATSRVQVRPIKLNQFESEGRTTDQVDIATEKDLVKSDVVAETIREELGLEGENRAILARVAVTTELDSLVLKITFEGDTAKQAKDGADAAAAGYLKQRADTATATRDSSVAKLNEDIAAVEQSLTEAQAAFDAAPDGPEKSQLRVDVQTLQNELKGLQDQRTELNQFDPATVGALVRKASLPPATTSKMAMGKGIGVFGLFLLAGLGIAYAIDRRDSMGGGRRRIEQILPEATMRVMPGAEGGSASPAEIDTAIDRMAVELVAGGSHGSATAVLVIGAGMEPPVALAEELASSLAFAGIPALFVLAGPSEREVRGARIVSSFADLVTSGGSLAGPAGLPAQAGAAADPAIAIAGPMVSWLRPKGSAEAAGLLRRAVVDSLVTRAGRERFEAVVFVAPSPTRTAAGSALGQWMQRTALVVAPEERSQAEPVATALADAGVRVTEVVWT